MRMSQATSKENILPSSVDLLQDSAPIHKIRIGENINEMKTLLLKMLFMIPPSVKVFADRHE
jgi:hypothetical protein